MVDSKVRFIHQGRDPGVGLDCVGFVMAAAGAAGYDARPYDELDYTGRPDLAKLQAALAKAFVEDVGGPVIAAGRIALLVGKTCPAHVAVLGDGTVIHASANRRVAVEHRLDRHFRSLIVATYSLPEPEAE